jgi:uncharacterized protein (AIM24 family)
MIYNYQNLPAHDNLNRFSYCIEVHKEMIIQKGKMIAYYGSLRFESLGSNLLDILVKEAFNAPLYIHDFVVVTGSGKLILGDRGNDIASYNIEKGNITIKSSHVIGFEPTLTCEECTLPGYLTLLGTGTLLASTNGPVHFMEPPACVDEQAILGWADLPCPSYHYDYSHVQGILSSVGALTGITLSGEEKQVNFTGQGTIMVQSSEQALLGRSFLVNVISQISGMNTNDLERIQTVVTSRLNNA